MTPASNANVHLRSIALGLSAQLCAAMCYTLLEDDERVASFLGRYGAHWEKSYEQLRPNDRHPLYDRNFARIGGQLRDRLAKIRAVTRGFDSAGLSPVERDWIEHCQQLRWSILSLVDSGALEGGPALADPDTAMRFLLSSYVHMTNNRLGVSTIEETYLSHVMRLAILDGLPEVVGVS